VTHQLFFDYDAAFIFLHLQHVILSCRRTTGVPTMRSLQSQAQGSPIVIWEPRNFQFFAASCFDFFIFDMSLLVFSALALVFQG